MSRLESYFFEAILWVSGGRYTSVFLSCQRLVKVIWINKLRHSKLWDFGQWDWGWWHSQENIVTAQISTYQVFSESLKQYCGSSWSGNKWSKDVDICQYLHIFFTNCHPSQAVEGWNWGYCKMHVPEEIQMRCRIHLGTLAKLQFVPSVRLVVKTAVV